MMQTYAYRRLMSSTDKVSLGLTHPFLALSASASAEAALDMPGETRMCLQRTMKRVRRSSTQLENVSQIVEFG